MAKTIKAASPIKEVNNIKINTSLMSTHNCNVRANREVSYIVLHYTGNKGPDSAKNNAAYFKTAKIEASAHYTVDDNNIYQCVALKNTAWHCGGKTYYSKCRNATSIGIEMCCTAGNYKVGARTIENAAHLTAALCQELGIAADDVPTYVVRHYDVTHKQCPKQMAGTNNKEWRAFLNRVQRLLGVDVAEKSVTQPSKVTSIPYTVKVKDPNLNIRKGPGTNFAKTGRKTGVGTFTIVEVSDGLGSKSGWGLLKSYEKKRDGWISLYYTERV